MIHRRPRSVLEIGVGVHRPRTPATNANEAEMVYFALLAPFPFTSAIGMRYADVATRTASFQIVNGTTCGLEKVSARRFPREIPRMHRIGKVPVIFCLAGRAQN